MEKPQCLQQIILPPYINRGQQRIIREKQKNILSVPFLDVELRYWYRVGHTQRGIHSRPYTYVLITLESSLLLVAFLLLALILRIVTISPDAPINVLIAQRNYFLTKQNSIAAKRLVRSIDEHFYRQYRYLIKGTIPISVFVIMLAIAAIMILTGPESRFKRYSVCLLHLIMLITTTVFSTPSLLHSQFRIQIFASNKFIMQDDFLIAWFVAASYEIEKISHSTEKIIPLFENKYHCCVVNRNATFWQQFSTHLIIPYVFSTNSIHTSLKYYIKEWADCDKRTEILSEKRKITKGIIQCSALMPRMEDGLELLHLCYIIIIIISIILCFLLTFSNFAKWFLECADEKNHIEDMRNGKAIRIANQQKVLIRFFEQVISESSQFYIN